MRLLRGRAFTAADSAGAAGVVIVNEKLARAIFHCSIPVVTGIGHETDTTLIDFDTLRFGDPAFDPALALLCGMVFRILRQVAMRACFLDGPNGFGFLFFLPCAPPKVRRKQAEG